MRFAVFYLALYLVASKASAGAWVLPMGETKASAQFSERSQRLHFPLAPARGYTLRETHTSLLLEHGLSQSVTLVGKLSQQRFSEALRVRETQTSQMDLQVAAPKLAAGLLPPYVFLSLKKLFPKTQWRREKVASVRAGIDWQSGKPDQSGYLSVSLADKVSAGRLSVLQEVEFSESRLSREHHVNGQYRFSIQRGNWQIGSQAEQFENQTTGYLSLKHSLRLTWKPEPDAYEITLGRGHTRVNNRHRPLTQFQRGQQWTLEFQQNF